MNWMPGAALAGTALALVKALAVTPKTNTTTTAVTALPALCFTIHTPCASGGLMLSRAADSEPIGADFQGGVSSDEPQEALPDAGGLCELRRSARGCVCAGVPDHGDRCAVGHVFDGSDSGDAHWCSEAFAVADHC